MSGYTMWAVEYTDGETGEERRVPCVSRDDATRVALALFPLHYSVRVTSEVM